MIDEIKKSISATLYERTTSPLFGTFLFSWILWNWKIILVLFATNSQELETTKFEYIENNLLNYSSGIIYPVASTILILTLYAWLAEKAYQLWLYFDKRKLDLKNEIEKNKLLTLDQSIKLRLEISKKEESFDNLLKEKEKLIQVLRAENSELLKQNSQNEIINTSDVKEDFNQDYSDEIRSFFKNEDAVAYIEDVAQYVQYGWSMDSEKIPENILTYYLAFDIIQKVNDNGVFEFTPIGKQVLREYFKTKHNTK